MKLEYISSRLMESNLLILIFFLLSIVQSILGVGILVIGTPVLLLLEYKIPEILSLLLPISILTSLINFIILKGNKKNKEFDIDKKINYYFFVICLPAIFLGIYFLEIFNTIFNFKILVSIIILSSLIIKYFFSKKINLMSKFIKKIVMFVIGIIHGFTNSGGTILSLFFSNKNNSSMTEARLNITYFYLLLASFQYLIFIFFFKIFTSKIDLIYFFIISIIGSLLGNIFVNYINEKYFRHLIEFLAFVASIFLILNN